MDNISEHMNYKNHKIHSYYQMSKFIVNVGSNTYDNMNSSSPHISCIHNSLLMRIVETTKNDLSHVEGKLVTGKIFKYSVKPSSTLSSC